ncbi:hypothetical protein AAVH_14464 [Aphelenchoides avenae]|nr:hypothetical protein AAVH_14464 [Aphelenchus avenae]
MMVAEVGESRTFPSKKDGKKPIRLLTVRLINDEEEPIKLLIWGDQAIDMQKSLKQGALYRFVGVDVKGEYNRRYGFGHLGVEFTLRLESQVDMVRPVYSIRGLPLVHEAEIDPRSSWRIRVRAVVDRQFSRYYQGDTGLSGDVIVGRSLHMQVVLHNVPMTYANAFTVGTEVEMKGHISMKEQLVEFDAQWEDVCNVAQLKRNVWTTSEDQAPVRQSMAEPDTPTATTMHAFYNSPAASSPSASTSGSGREEWGEHRAPGKVNNVPMWQNKNVAVGSVANVGSVNNDRSVAARPFGIAIPKRYEFVATLNYPFAFNDLLGIHSTNAMLMDRKPPVPLRIKANTIPDRILEMLGSGTRTVVRGLVDLEGRTLVMRADQDDGILPEGYVNETVLDFSLAADISGVDKKLHRIAAKIVEGFCSVEGSNNYTGSVLVEDDDMVAITLTVRGVPDDKAHMFCKSAMIEATGIITGDDFVMEMTCNWDSDVTIRPERAYQDSPSKSPSSTGSIELLRGSRMQRVDDKNLESSDSDTDQVQLLGSVDKEGQDQPIGSVKARPIKQENLEDDTQYTSAGLNAADSSTSLQETPKSRSSSSAASRKRKAGLRKDPKKNTKLSDFVLP